jgi:hypothetical protein
MKRLIAVLAAFAITLGGRGGPSPAEAAEAAAATTSCCWLYCETYRDLCFWTMRDDREYCDAWYAGCIDGCQYGRSPESGAF